LCLPNCTTLIANVGWLGHHINWVFAAATTKFSHQLLFVSFFALPHLLLFFGCGQLKIFRNVAHGLGKNLKME
jgi:hypothetical protein